MFHPFGVSPPFLAGLKKNKEETPAQSGRPFRLPQSFSKTIGGVAKAFQVALFGKKNRALKSKIRFRDFRFFRLFRCFSSPFSAAY
jgi:hypothetical protein